MSKFKEGDKVKLRYGLETFETYGELSFMPDMFFDGYREVANVENGKIGIYGVNRYRYTDEMLELLEEPILLPSDCPEPTFLKQPHYSILGFRHKFSPIRFTTP